VNQFVSAITDVPLKRLEIALTKQQGGSVLTDKVKQEIKKRFPDATIILL